MCKEADETEVKSEEASEKIPEANEAPKQEEAKTEEKSLVLETPDRIEAPKSPGKPAKQEGKIPKGLPEPGKPVSVPKDSMIPPQKTPKMDHKNPTIANEEVFQDQDLSSISM